MARNRSNEKFEKFIEHVPNRKRGSFVQNLEEYAIEWTENTSLHGVRYIGERRRNIFEKLWWLIALAISLYFCVGQIARVHQKWDTSPIVVSFAPTPLWKIPFPAVTICPQTKSIPSVFNFTHYYHKVASEWDNVTDEEWKKYQDIALVCDTHLINEGELYADSDTLDSITEVAPELEDVLWTCKWTNKNETCDQLFTPVLTEEGVCYTFNTLDRDDIFKDEVYHHQEHLELEHRSAWTLEEGYAEEAGVDTFPRRAISTGRQAGLTILMKEFNHNLDYLCQGVGQGFKILLHHPGETPTLSTRYFRAPLNQEVIVAVKPDMMTTSDGLRDYQIARRQCYFSSERVLRFYRNYTQHNCEVECLTNYTLNKCGCVAFHMPHNESTKICGTGSVDCMHEAKHELLVQKVEKEFNRKASKGPENEESFECNCLPACTSLNYNSEILPSDFNWIKILEAFKTNTSEFSGMRLTRLTIFFKENQFITTQRNEFYGATDFLANCGGLLALFLGFSLLSLVEAIYFLTLRLLCNIRRHGRNFWSGSPDSINDDSSDRII